jgi:uncharacterized protein YjaZ
MDQQELVGAVAAAANVEPHLAQEALAEEKNDANAAVSLLLKRQEEAELVAVQEGKAGQGAAQPRNTSSAGAVGRAAKPHTAGQLLQQSGKEQNNSQAHEIQRPRASGNPQMAKPKGNTKGKGTGEGHLTADSAPTDESMYGALTRVVQPPRCWQREAGASQRYAR